MANERKIPLLAQLIRELQSISVSPDTPEWQLESALPTSTELSKSLSCDRETTKKLLKTLIQWNVVHPIGYHPKRYRFDQWHFDQLIDDIPSNDPLLDSVIEALNA